MKISREEVKRIATLARLSLGDAETDAAGMGLPDDASSTRPWTRAVGAAERSAARGDAAMRSVTNGIERNVIPSRYGMRGDGR